MATVQNKFAQDDKATQKEFAAVINTIKKIKAGTLTGFNLSDFKDVIDLRPGFKVSDGKMKNQKAIVFLVDKKKDPDGTKEQKLLPKTINGIPTDVTPISPFEFLRLAHMDAVNNNEPVKKKTGLTFMLDSSDFNSPDFKSATDHISKIGYKKPPASLVSLVEVKEPMTIICHVSPEEGWNQLKPFLNDTQKELRLGMYDYSAPHINDHLVAVKGNGPDFNFVYDGKKPAGAGAGVKAGDFSEDKINTNITNVQKGAFTHVKARLGNGGLFANAYHIKVAVKDKKSFWLSSGNWQSSNQPNIKGTPALALPANLLTVLNEYNREWHIIVENETLANIYYKFLKWDEDQSAALPPKLATGAAVPIAEPEDVMPQLTVSSTIVDKNKIRSFAPASFSFNEANPLRIQPVLTPDNYIDIIQPLIEGAKKKIYFQNQYITISKTGDNKYHGLLTALKEKSNDKNIETRFILRQEGNVRLMLENLKNFGFDNSKIKIQNNCHNKGIIIDDEIIILGSHNWSNSGVETNRDATLVIFNAQVQKYYLEVFNYDWDNMSQEKIFEDPIVTRNKKGVSSLL